MSAYQCHVEHFAAIVGSALSYDRQSHRLDSRATATIPWLDGDENRTIPERVARCLARENARSVGARYNHDPEDADAPTAKQINRWYYNPLKPVELLKACAGLEYQSCESADWESTPAKSIVVLIQGLAIRALPGYDAGPWGIDAPPKGNLVPIFAL